MENKRSDDGGAIEAVGRRFDSQAQEAYLSLWRTYDRLRALEDENAKLKRLLAEAMLDNAGLKDLLAKNW